MIVQGICFITALINAVISPSIQQSCCPRKYNTRETST